MRIFIFVDKYLNQKVKIISGKYGGYCGVVDQKTSKYYCVSVYNRGEFFYLLIKIEKMDNSVEIQNPDL